MTYFFFSGQRYDTTNASAYVIATLVRDWRQLGDSPAAYVISDECDRIRTRRVGLKHARTWRQLVDALTAARNEFASELYIGE